MIERAIKARELLLAAIRPGGQVGGAGLFAAATPADWRELLRLARAHQIEALLYEGIRALGVAIAPEIAQSLRMAHFGSAGRNGRIFHRLSRVLESFHDARVPVIPLKGAYLAQHVYANIAFRPMCDVDLLVREEDLRRTEDLLLKLGFDKRNMLVEAIDEANHFVYTHPEHDLCIEVHWGLIPVTSGIRVDIDGVWQRSRPVEIAGAPVLGMSHEDLILHLCVHAAMHRFDMGLRAMSDISQTLGRCREEFDWAVLLERARQWGAQRCVHVSLQLAKKLLDAPAPAGRLECADVGDFDGRYLSLAEEFLFERPEEPEKGLPWGQNLVEIWTDKGVSAKILRIRESLFPSRKVMAMKYPAPPDSWRIFLYYPVRIKDVLKKHVWTTMKLVARDAHTVSRAERQRRVNALGNWLLSG